LDLGVFVGSVDNELTHQSISGTGVAMELYFVRDTPHRRTPIEISIFGEYGVFKSQKFYALGGSIFRRTDDTRKAFIQPFLTVSGSWQEKYNQSETSVALGVSIALKMAEASVFHVTPSFGKAGDGIAFGVDAGFVFGKARRHNTAVKKENEKQWEF
ncbi:MAG: hypothetical protein ACREBV_07120, partial [Candidatus Zixiibacteriota bacterium]